MIARAAWITLVAACGFEGKAGSDAPSLVDDVAIDGAPVSGDDARPIDAALPCATRPGGILAWWPGDGDATDIVGTFEGALEANATAVAPGVVGSAFEFDGSLDQVWVQPAPQSVMFTIEAWVDLSVGLGGYETVYADGPRGLWLVGNKVVWWQGSNRYVSTGSVVPGEWHHIALTYDGVRFVGFIDGVEQNASAAYTMGSLPPNAGIGGHDNEYAAGMIDELAVYDRPLAQTEIAAIALARQHGKCRPVAPPPN